MCHNSKCNCSVCKHTRRIVNQQNLDRLLRNAKPMTVEEREVQRRSFAFGNVNLHNPKVTRELINKVADELSNAVK